MLNSLPFINILNSQSHNNVKLGQHLETVIDYITSTEYRQESLVQVSKKIKICNNKRPSKDPQSTKNLNEKLETQIFLNRTDNLLKFKSPIQQLNLKNFQIDSKKFYWAGISFGDQLSLLIHQSIKKLAVETKAKDIRFWGKITCRTKDYFIAQGILNNLSYQEVQPGAQKLGQGVNYYTYWATTNILSQWTELPAVTPQLIDTSRKLKRIFTGNLKAPVKGYPIFKGNESHYLKCQIVRITHTCQIAPRGIFKVNQQNPKVIEFEDQYKVPEFNDLTTPESWVHQNQAILNSGRCGHWISPQTPQQQKEALQAELVEKDPQIQRLKGINQDKCSEKTGTGLQNPWYTKIYGDSQVFTKEQAPISYAVVAFKNIYWPGWTTIGYKNGWASIYIGDGLKSIQQFFTPIENKDIQQEGQDLVQFHQPNPKELPVIEEPNKQQVPQQ